MKSPYMDGMDCMNKWAKRAVHMSISKKTRRRELDFSIFFTAEAQRGTQRAYYFSWVVFFLRPLKKKKNPYVVLCGCSLRLCGKKIAKIEAKTRRGLIVENLRLSFDDRD